MKRDDERERQQTKKKKKKKEEKEKKRKREDLTATVEGRRGETWQREKPLISLAWKSFSAT